MTQIVNIITYTCINCKYEYEEKSVTSNIYGNILTQSQVTKGDKKFYKNEHDKMICPKCGAYEDKLSHKLKGILTEKYPF